MDLYLGDGEVLLNKKERGSLSSDFGVSKSKGFSAQLRKLAFVEVFSPPRAARHSDCAGVECLGRFDEEGGWAFIRGDRRQEFRMFLKTKGRGW